jgi:hypothetical protein
MSSSQWARKFSRFGRDGYQLARAVIQTRSVKPVLLEHARQSNSVAHSLLHVDKQVGLVKYYGLSGYVKQRLQSTMTTTGGAVDSTSTSTPTPNAGAAKVAFMVTASMKQELTERLGYEAGQIKQLTPLHASLILNNDIAPEDREARLPIAEEEYEVQRRLQEIEQQERMQLLEEEEEKLQLQQEQQPLAGSGSGFIPSPDFVFSGGYASINLLEHPSNDGFGDVWFEVTETEDGETSRVGLYYDEEEATIGMQARQYIADRKGRELTFAMHPVSRESLFLK